MNRYLQPSKFLSAFAASLFLFLSNPCGWSGQIGLSSLQWTEVAGLPVARDALAATVFDGDLYAIGGESTSGVSQTNMFRYDGVVWTEVAGLPAARFLLASVVFNGDMYVFGGGYPSGATFTNMYKYDGSNWTEVVGLPGGGRSAVGAGVLDGLLYAVGGWQAGAIKTNVYRYNGTNWAEVVGLPAAHNYPKVGVLNGYLYVVGGFDGSTTKTNVYRFDGVTWNEVAGLPVAGQGGVVGAVEETLFAVGGVPHDGGVVKTNLYHYDGTVWEEAEGLPVGRTYSGLGVLDDSLYVIGGRNTDGYVNAKTNVFCCNVGYFGGVTPNSCSISGGVEVVIGGMDLCSGELSDVTNVTLCGIQASLQSVSGATQITVVAGASGVAATGDVRVYSISRGETVKTGGFTYFDQSPAAPTSVMASDGMYTNKVRITWSAVHNAESYQVWRHTADDSNAAVELTSGVAGTTYDDTNATLDVTYYYWIKAANAEGISQFSPVDSGWCSVGEPPNCMFFLAGGKLYRMGLDGGDSSILSDSVGDAESLAADRVNNFLYMPCWSARILRYDALGGGTVGAFCNGPGPSGGQGLAYDPAAGKLFLGLYYNGVYSMATNNLGVWQQLVTATDLSPMHGQRGQLALDPYNQHIYFRSVLNNPGTQDRYIWRVGYEGNGLIQVVKANGGEALALDLSGGNMYFSDEPGHGTLKRAALDGSGVQVVLTLNAPYTTLLHLDLDLAAGKIYMYLATDDWNDKAIARADMDGSNFVILKEVKNTSTNWRAGLALFTLPDVPSLPVPVGVSASDGIYTNMVRVAWGAVAGATSYRVWRHVADDSGAASELVSGIVGTNYNDINAVAGATYYYWVKAANTSAVSGFSASDAGFVASVPVNNLLLWNRLGSASEIAHSEVGTNGIVENAVVYAPVMHGDGVALVTGSSLVKFPRPFGNELPVEGCIEFWWTPAHNEDSSTGSHFAERNPFVLSSVQTRPDGWPAVEILVQYRSHSAIAYNRTLVHFIAYDVGTASLRSFYAAYELDFMAGQVMHLALSWNKAWGAAGVKLFKNGVEVLPVYNNGADVRLAIDTMRARLPSLSYDLALLRRPRRPDGAAAQFDAEMYLDNMKIWNYAKTDFEDRFVDGAKAFADVILNNLNQTYDGTAKVVTATTVPSGLVVDITYDGHAWAPTNVGTYAIIGVVNDVNYQGVTTGALVVTASPVTPPAAPSSVSASDGTYTNMVRVTWNAVSNAASYQVWRHTSDDYTAAAELANGVTGTDYDDTTVAAGVAYYYWVRAVNAGGIGPFSGSDSGFASSGVPVEGVADVALSGLVFMPATFNPGESPELAVALLANNGPAALQGEMVTLEFFLSGNMALDDGDDLRLGEYPAMVTIDPAGHTTVILNDAGLASLKIPMDALGLYYVIARVRVPETLFDPDLNNNVLVRSGMVAVGDVNGAKIPVSGDFDGDGLADPAVYQESAGLWQVLMSAGGYRDIVTLRGFGGEGLTPFAGDYDGDGRADPAVYDEASGYWEILLSGSGYAKVRTNLGGVGYKPVAGDFNGMGRMDLGVYGEANRYWLFVMTETMALTYESFGRAGFKPVAGDYDGDGRTDLGLYHPKVGGWFVKLSSVGLIYELENYFGHFGGQGWTPVTGDYDGDGKSDLVIYKEANGTWQARLSLFDYVVCEVRKFGGHGWLPVMGDYDGDGKDDLVIFNAETGAWKFRLSAQGYREFECQL